MMCKNFEAAVAHLLTMDPVEKRRATGTKRGTDNILDTTSEVSAFGSKPSTAKTGVQLRYHTDAKYKRFKKYQNDELR